MALKWDITRCKHPFTGLAETLIWSCLIVDLDGITEKNATEFHRRISEWEKVGGTLRTDDGKDVPLTLEEVREYIGLRTNVHTKTKRAFESKLARYALEVARRKVA